MEANKLIAEFMGGIVEMYTEWNSGETWEICTLPKESNPLYMQNPNAYGIGVFKTEDFKRKNVNVHERCLQYHQSWDWLMPVVEKITQETKEFSSGNIDSCLYTPLASALIRFTDINLVYDAVVEFIKFYNQNK